MGSVENYPKAKADGADEAEKCSFCDRGVNEREKEEVGS